MPDDTDAGSLWVEWNGKEAGAANSNGRSIEAVLSDEYKDAGYWGRHYSTVRMTLGTFFLTAATAVITQRLEKPDVGVLLLACGIALAGVVLFCLFTHLTFQEMNKQARIVKAYRKVLNPGAETRVPTYHFWMASGGWVVVGFVVLFGGFATAWMLKAFVPAAKDDGSVTMPIRVTIGGSVPVTLDVPVQVEGVAAKAKPAAAAGSAPAQPDPAPPKAPPPVTIPATRK